MFRGHHVDKRILPRASAKMSRLVSVSSDEAALQLAFMATRYFERAEE